MSHYTLQTQCLTKRVHWSDVKAAAPHVVSMGWLPANSAVLRCSRVVKQLTSAATACDVGFRGTDEHTADDDAFTPTAFALGTALGVVHAAPAADALYFSKPAEVIVTVTPGSTLTAGEAFISVEWVDYRNAEEF